MHLFTAGPDSIRVFFHFKYLDHNRRRSTNVKPTLIQRLLSARMFIISLQKHVGICIHLTAGPDYIIFYFIFRSTLNSQPAFEHFLIKRDLHFVKSE